MPSFSTIELSRKEYYTLDSWHAMILEYIVLQKKKTMECRFGRWSNTLEVADSTVVSSENGYWWMVANDRVPCLLRGNSWTIAEVLSYDRVIVVPVESNRERQWRVKGPFCYLTGIPFQCRTVIRLTWEIEWFFTVHARKFRLCLKTGTGNLARFEVFFVCVEYDSILLGCEVMSNANSCRRIGTP